MRSVTKTPVVCSPTLALTAPHSRVNSRLADYVELIRPRIAVMVLITVTVGYLLGQQGRWDATATTVLTLFHACFGIILVTAGSSSVNQWFEQFTDARMERTSTRPLPSGRLSSREVLCMGLLFAVTGCLYLFWFVNLLTAVLTGLTFALYGGVYTPLKRWTSLCTAIGAIPGAMPPVLGWTAAGQPLDMHAFALFGLLFFWQFPHFLAIAWLHREDYSRAGLRMLPGGMPLQRVTGLMATCYALGLIPVSLIPGWLGMAGTVYSVIALIAGVLYLAAAIAFAWEESRPNARRVLWVSLIYLPVVLAALAADHIRLLQVLG